MSDTEWTQADGYEWRRDGATIYMRPTPTAPPKVLFTLPASAPVPHFGRTIDMLIPWND